jgi:hypothetical protein
MSVEPLGVRAKRVRDMLLGHERSASVVWFDGFHVRSGDHAMRLPGVHEWMRTHVYPEYCFRDSYRRGSAVKRTKGRRAWTSVKAAAAQGRNAGLAAHADVEFCVTASAAEMRARRKPISGHAQHLVAAMAAHGLHPVLSEFVVYDEDRFATPVDVVCVRKTPRVGQPEIVLVELKTARTRDAFLTPGKHRMRAPFEFLWDGQASQALVQVGLAQMVLRARYGIEADTLVLFSPHDKNEVIRIDPHPQMARAALPALYTRLPKTPPAAHGRSVSRAKPAAAKTASAARAGRGKAGRH